MTAAADRAGLKAALAIAPYLDAPIPLHVGSCVETGGRFRAQAHAHTSGPYRGWICVLSARRTVDRSLVLHEVAHVISGQGHTDHWRRVLVAIGGTLDETTDQRDYHRRARRPGRFRGLFNVHPPACPCRRNP